MKFLSKAVKQLHIMYRFNRTTFRAHILDNTEGTQHILEIFSTLEIFQSQHPVGPEVLLPLLVEQFVVGSVSEVCAFLSPKTKESRGLYMDILTHTHHNIHDSVY